MLNNYLDGNYLVTPQPVNPVERPKRGSDNGILFTSQFIIHSIIQNYTFPLELFYSIEGCIDSDGYLHRAPDDPGLDTPDDHYGVLALSLLHGQRIPLEGGQRIPLVDGQRIPLGGAQSGGHSVPLDRLARRLRLPWKCMHPMLIYMRALARGNPLARLFSPIAAIIIYHSNRAEPPSETTDKILTDITGRTLSLHSALCRWAYGKWKRRMLTQYKSIEAIYTIYFGPFHPITLLIRD